MSLKAVPLVLWNVTIKCPGGALRAACAPRARPVSSAVAFSRNEDQVVRRDLLARRAAIGERRVLRASVTVGEVLVERALGLAGLARDVRANRRVEVVHVDDLAIRRADRGHESRTAVPLDGRNVVRLHKRVRQLTSIDAPPTPLRRI